MIPVDKETDINPKKRCYSWVLTQNNYTELDVKRFDTQCQTAAYGIFAKEVGENGTPHIQAYLRFKNAKTFTTLKKTFPKAHIQAAKGTDDDNYIYITKDESFTEYGTRSKQGERTDLNKIKDEIMQGKKVDVLLLENPSIYHLYGRTLIKIEDVRMRKVFRTEMTTGEWYYGTTGTGKSEKAFENFNPDTHYVWKYDNGWNDGYM